MVEGINDINNNKYNKKAPSVASQSTNENTSIFSNSSNGMPSLIEGFEKNNERFNNPKMTAKKPTNIKNNSNQKPSSATK